jgi:Zn-dependent protease with chaperone function
VPIDDSELPLRPIEPPSPPTPAPAWVALAAAWTGLLMLVASIVFVFLPGTKNPVQELEHLRPYSVADWFLVVPMYGIALAIFLGIVVIWQMRYEKRPLQEALVNQRVQAWVGIVLAVVGAGIIYFWVGSHGPK